MSTDERNEKRRFDELAARILAGTATRAEREEYAGWLTGVPEDGEPLHVPAEFAPGREAHEARILAGIRQRIGPGVPVATIISVRRRWKTASAVAAALMLVAGGVWLLTRTKDASTIVAAAPQHPPQDVAAPAVNRATITLSNGQRVYLDSAADGPVARQGNTSIQKLAGGELLYKSQGQGGQNTAPAGETREWNTLTNPRGSQPISLTLTDGSRVWLNAASSLRYPASFVRGERRVELLGEGYFAIAKNASAPFVVVRGGTEIRVLGTEFNVNAYADEPGIRVTLLSGSVKVNSQLLKPGEQAFVQNDGDRVDLEAKADTQAAVAWRHGLTVFHHADVATILRAIGRWYDVDVTLQGEIPKRSFFAEISRSATLSELLTVFRVNHIHYTLDAAKRQLTIMP